MLLNRHSEWGNSVPGVGARPSAHPPVSAPGVWIEQTSELINLRPLVLCIFLLPTNFSNFSKSIRGQGRYLTKIVGRAQLLRYNLSFAKPFPSPARWVAAPKKLLLAVSHTVWDSELLFFFLQSCTSNFSPKSENFKSLCLWPWLTPSIGQLWSNNNVNKVNICIL